MDDKLVEESKDSLGVPMPARIEAERASLLMEVKKVTLNFNKVFAQQLARKNDDYTTLQENLAQLEKEYLLSTEAVIANTRVLDKIEKENALLKATNKGLESKIAVNTQNFAKNKQETEIKLKQLSEEKEVLVDNFKKVKEETRVKTTVVSELDQEIQKLKQDRKKQEQFLEQLIREKAQIEKEYYRLTESVLEEKALIADLFRNAKRVKAVRKTP
ncbi:hypothetical protein [Lactococcus allomyrinae]|uniref:Uncharacterized protein n=1 Tax=Lactococcus allomyrinae TaxID=2419773 RepID=A0A387BQT8_9LACT|nr:hypothetical protein [Lactococcus allomyrinae]AYG00851.1 hypothetical protein D7I46_06925 [Lactococcus allomyrinae]